VLFGARDNLATVIERDCLKAAGNQYLDECVDDHALVIDNEDAPLAGLGLATEIVPGYGALLGWRAAHQGIFESG